MLILRKFVRGIKRCGDLALVVETLNSAYYFGMCVEQDLKPEVNEAVNTVEKQRRLQKKHSSLGKYAATLQLSEMHTL